MKRDIHSLSELIKGPPSTGDTPHFAAPTGWQSLPSALNVRAFGARGDGQHDDTTAIQEAYAQAAAHGVVLLFPDDGVYLLKSPTPYVPVLNVTTAGVRIVATANAILKAHTSSADGIRLIQVGADDVTIEGMGFDPSGITSATCIYADTAARLTVRGNRFTDPRSGGVNIANAVTDLLIDGNTFHGVGYGVLTNDPTSGGRWAITNNVFRGAGANDADAIGLNCPTTGVSDVVVSGNRISNYQGVNQNVGFGIALAKVKNAAITGNSIDGCSRNGIHLEDMTGDAVVTGNTVRNCGNAGIELQGVVSGGVKYCESVAVVGNSVQGCCQSAALISPPQGFAGIEVGQQANTRGVTIVGNVSKGNGTASIAAAGIYLFNAPDSIVSANLCKNNNGPGIQLTTVLNAIITGNRCFDDQAVKTQTYGITTFGTAAGAIVANNNFAGNLTGAASDGFSTAPVWGENVGLSIGGPLHRLEGWVADNVQNPLLGLIPANSVITNARLYVKEAFNSDGTDLISVGIDANLVYVFTDTDVSTIGVKAPTMGAAIGTLNSVSRQVEAYYTNGGSEPTTGKALVIVEYYLVTAEIA